jgi:potassium-transporting ATPase KdpC subunit
MALVRPAFTLLLVFSVLLGLVYPALITGIAHVAFPSQAEGSLLHDGDRIVGSSLIGQPFSDPRYFWGRPSSTAPVPYNGAASTGSNLGPMNPELRAAVAVRIKMLHEADPSDTDPIPIDLVTASASGLDPHISPAAAYYQVARVAHARSLREEAVRAVVEHCIETRTFGVLGEPRVNVLRLNRALDHAGP